MIRLGTVVALCSTIACGDSAPQVPLVRIGGACGAVSDARTLLIRALSDDGEVSRAISVGAVALLADLPASTRQLSVEVLGSAGVVRAIGKSAPLAYGDLQTGDAVRIAMAPPSSACPTEGLLEPRTAPVLARAGRFVLVLGGQGAAGPLATAELYDPETDRFEAVEVPSRLAAAGSFVGAAATTLGDGRVVVSGGPTGSYTVFDPKTRRFGPPIVLEPRFFHGAVALGGDQLLVAGGCRGVTGATCNGEPARTTFRLSVDSDQQALTFSLERDHVQPTLLLDPGSGGRGPAVLVIGSATAQGLPAQVSERLELASGAVVAIAGTSAVAAALDSGAVLTGFATGPLAAQSDTSVLVPQLLLRPGTGGPALRGASLTALEDGTVLALGQSAADAPTAAIFHPTQSRWQTLALPPELIDLSGHRAVRLDDGSVLIVGAGRVGDPAITAWRFRPSLTGPFTASTIAVPTDERSAELTPSDPDAVELGSGRFELVGNRAGLSQWVLVGGPRLVDGQLTAVIRPPGGDGATGFAVVSHFESPASLVAIELVAGQPATARRVSGGEVTELCRGPLVPALDPGVAVTVTMSLRAGALSVRLAETPVLVCSIPEPPRGAWGLGVVGAARLGIDTLTVER